MFVLSGELDVLVGIDLDSGGLERLIHTLAEEMDEAAADLKLENVARLRDEIKRSLSTSERPGDVVLEHACAQLGQSLRAVTLVVDSSEVCVCQRLDFHTIDPVRGIRELGEIMEHVLARLGPDVELSLEVRATNNDGYDDATQRIVSENASNLGATSPPEFE